MPGLEDEPGATVASEPHAPASSSTATVGQLRKVIVRRVEVPVPMDELTASDCPREFSLPPSRAPSSGRAFELVVPAGVEAGCTLGVPLGEGESLAIWLPANAGASDRLRLVQRADGSWRVTKMATEFTFLLPECHPTDIVKLQGPDGTILSFAVPEGLQSEDLVTLRRCLDRGSKMASWEFYGKSSLPPFIESPAVVHAQHGPYQALIQQLRERGYMAALLAAAGERGEHGSSGAPFLRVSVPFCASFSEYFLLGGFLDTSLKRAGVEEATAVDILAAELCDRYQQQWGIAQRWFRRLHPRLRLCTRVMDLAEECLPESQLVIGIHPEVTKGDRWFQIVGAVVMSCGDGVCAFATFYEAEARTLVAMVDMYKPPDSVVELLENPFYNNHDRSGPTPMRYLVLVVATAVRAILQRSTDMA